MCYISTMPYLYNIYIYIRISVAILAQEAFEISSAPVAFRTIMAAVVPQALLDQVSDYSSKIAAGRKPQQISFNFQGVSSSELVASATSEDVLDALSRRGRASLASAVKANQGIQDLEMISIGDMWENRDGYSEMWKDIGQIPVPLMALPPPALPPSQTVGTPSLTGAPAGTGKVVKKKRSKTPAAATTSPGSSLPTAALTPVRRP